MDWKAELDFELADAQEIIWRLQTAVLRSDTITPEIADIAERLTQRAGVISGYVARLELLAAARESAQAPDPHQEVWNPELYWTPDQLKDGRRFMHRLNQARARNRERA